MAKLKSALLFGVINSKINMAANSPGSIWFGLAFIEMSTLGKLKNNDRIKDI